MISRAGVSEKEFTERSRPCILHPPGAEQLVSEGVIAQNAAPGASTRDRQMGRRVLHVLVVLLVPAKTAPAAAAADAVGAADADADAAAWNLTLQPDVTVVEGLPSTHGIASISKPGGSVWCGGAPTMWIAGHDGYAIDQPLCRVADEETGGVAWVRPASNGTALSSPGGDRHACVTMDVNRDGLDDVLCNAGAGGGRGRGENGVYLTQPDGTLTKLNVTTTPHGLNAFPYMRNRVSVALRDADGVRNLVFMGTLGTPRPDGQSNHHRMFRNVYESPDRFPYFVEVPGPWTAREFVTLRAEAGDITGDGLDDLIVCDIRGPAVLAAQRGDGAFRGVALPKSNRYVEGWRSVRISDVTGDGLPDLVVVTWPNRTAFLRVFEGVPKSPHFDFATPYFQAPLKYVASDVEVLDVNQDGLRDIYVVQVDEARGKYCFHHGVKRLPHDVVPPRDNAPDLLFLGTGTREGGPFTKVVMSHAEPGCGNLAQRWGDQTMLLGQGSFDNPGYQLLLEWSNG